MLNFSKSDRIMVVVAHPDDELLGLGGTMHKVIREVNPQVRVVILGEGITSRDNTRDVAKRSDDLGVHNSNIVAAGKAIGYHDIKTYQLPDNRFDSVPLLDVIKIVEKEKSDFKPNVIFTHHGGDLNVDRRMTFQAVVTATRPMKDEMVETLLTFETPSGTEWRPSTDPSDFIPNVFFEIDKEDVDAKILGMESYEFERREFPHPRSPEALETLARYRGLSVGMNYAECFSVVRMLKR